jgi:hypothetical protein
MGKPIAHAIAALLSVAHYRAIVRVRVGERFAVELLDRSETTGHVWTIEAFHGVAVVTDGRRSGRLGQRRLVIFAATRAGDGELRLREEPTRQTVAPASTWQGRVIVEGRKGGKHQGGAEVALSRDDVVGSSSEVL